MQTAVKQTGGTVGRKRKPVPKKIRDSYAGKFGMRLANLAAIADLDANELGKKIGKTGDMVRIYYAGRSVPPLNDWPKLAYALGLSSVRELLPE